MKFALSQIKKNAYNEPFKFDDYVDVSELETMNNDIRKIQPVRVHGNCSEQGEQILCSFEIEGEMILPCARTLVDVPYSFKVEATEVFTTSSYSSGEEEDEIHPVNGEVLDLTPYIKENILLEIPFRVFSDEANPENAAPIKGKDWEYVTEEKKEKTIDPRFQKLASLLENKQKDK